jgi:hypothetical protein
MAGRTNLKRVGEGETVFLTTTPLTNIKQHTYLDFSEGRRMLMA